MKVNAKTVEVVTHLLSLMGWGFFTVHKFWVWLCLVRYHTRTNHFPVTIIYYNLNIP